MGRVGDVNKYFGLCNENALISMAGSSDENKVIRIAKCNAFLGLCESIP